MEQMHALRRFNNFLVNPRLFLQVRRLFPELLNAYAARRCLLIALTPPLLHHLPVINDYQIRPYQFLDPLQGLLLLPSPPRPAILLLLLLPILVAAVVLLVDLDLHQESLGLRLLEHFVKVDAEDDEDEHEEEGHGDEVP